MLKLRRALSALLCAGMILLMPACSKNVQLGTGGTQTAYYAYGDALAGVFKQKGANYQIKNVASGSSAGNIQNVNEHKIDFGLAQNDICHYAYNGDGYFKGETYENFGAVAALFSLVCHIVAGRGINSVEELQGKSVVVGLQGSPAERNAMQVLEAYGLGIDNIFIENMEFEPAKNALKNGLVDALIYFDFTASGFVAEMSRETELNILRIDEQHLEILKEIYPFYCRYEIRDESDKEGPGIATVALKMELVAASALDEETVFEFTKLLFEYSGAVAAAHQFGTELTPVYAVDGLTTPLHPGALRYYTENGIL